MKTLPDDVVHHLLATCPGRTDEALQSAFGISYNTWRRICRGEPLRSSVAERLIDRIRNAGRTAAAPPTRVADGSCPESGSMG